MILSNISVRPAAPHISMESPAGSDHGSASAAVCCMCGDHGLPGELFQCGLCRLRLQHRYCSELYPREAAHRSCNWCLREEGGAGGRNTPAKTPTAASKRGLQRLRHEYSCGMTSPSGACSRSAFSAEPEKPVKKPKRKKKGAGRMVVEQRPVKTAAMKGRREVQEGAAGRKARFSRVKVRRYKLLAEVICYC